MKLSLLILTLLYACPIFSQQRIYVNATAAGSNTGQTWADAYPNLHTALQGAKKGDSIWVAEGVYLPDAGGNRKRSFELKSGVRLFGGFSGVESAFSQRDFKTRRTILSGDIGTVGDSTDNAYTILYMVNPDSGTVVDGFIFERGNADYSGLDLPARVPEKCGGAIYIMARDGWAYPDIQNCTFQCNYAFVHGGAVFINGAGLGSVAPRFLYCTFRNNRAKLNGGGVFKDGASWVERTPDFGHCTFLDNEAGRSGGGFYLSDSDRTDQQDIAYCTFTRNHAISLNGGGTCFNVGRDKGSKIRIYGCTYLNNRASDGDHYGMQNLRLLETKLFIVDSCYFEGLINESNYSTSADLIGGYQHIRKNSFMNCDFLFFGTSDTCLVEKSVIRNDKKYNKNQNINVGMFAFFNNNRAYSDRPFSISNNFLLSIQNNILIVKNNESFLIYAVGLKYFSNNYCASKHLLFLSGNSKNNKITNSILVSDFISDPDYISSTILLGESSVTHCHLSTGNCGWYKTSCGPGNLIGIPPLFRDTANGDYSLLPCSPLINAGDNAAAAGLLTDLSGNPRILGGRVDIGPYEAPDFTTATQPLVQPACAGAANGRVALGATQGCPPYTYTWRNQAGTIGADTTALAPGRYFFTLTDARGRTALDTITVPESPRPTPLLQVQDLLCGAATGGSIAATLAAGAPAPLQYRWSNGRTTATASDLLPGAYRLTVTDGLGCRDSAAAQVALTGTLAFMAGGTPITCFGKNDGSVYLAPSNGKAPFRYGWNTGATDSLLTTLGPGAYSGTITDQYGCTAAFAFQLARPDSLRFTAAVQDASGPTATDGSITVSAVQGGTSPYRYDWNTGSMAQALLNLAPGTYTATVTDDRGCAAVQTLLVRGIVGTDGPAGRRAMLVLYPNPATDFVHITWQAATPSGQRLRIFDAQGRVLREEEVWMDATGQYRSTLEGLPAGVYTVQLGAAWGRLVKGN